MRWVGGTSIGTSPRTHERYCQRKPFPIILSSNTTGNLSMCLGNQPLIHGKEHGLPAHDRVMNSATTRLHFLSEKLLCSPVPERYEHVVRKLASMVVKVSLTCAACNCRPRRCCRPAPPPSHCSARQRRALRPSVKTESR